MRSALSIAAVLVATPLPCVGCFAKSEPIADESTGAASSGAASSGATSSGATTETGGDGTVLGPLVPLDDLDDGALYPAGSGYEAHWYPSGEENTEGRQYLGQFPDGMQYYGYLRFQLPQALPAGTIVDGAVLEIFGHDVYEWTSASALRVWVQDDPDAAAVTGTIDYPVDGSAVVFLDTSARWPKEDGLVWQQPGPNATPDLAPLVQALIDAQGGLAADAHVQFWIASDVLDGSGEEVGWLDSIAGSETAPRLTITLDGP